MSNGENIQIISLADDLVDVVRFGDEDLSLRMGSKYLNLYAGPTLLRTPGGATIEVELTEMPLGPEDGISIIDLTVEQLRRNNALPREGEVTEAEIWEAKWRIAEGMQHYYPHEQHYGLDTVVYAIGWEQPEGAAELRAFRSLIKAALAGFFGKEGEVRHVGYSPELNHNYFDDADDIAPGAVVEYDVGWANEHKMNALDGWLIRAFGDAITLGFFDTPIHIEHSTESAIAIKGTPAELLAMAQASIALLPKWHPAYTQSQAQGRAGADI